MKMIKKTLLVASVLSTMGIASSAFAAVSASEAAKLGNELTPSGAIKAGNAEGTIPAWTGGLTEAPAGWDPTQGYVDPFKDEKPLFTITADNYMQYEDKLNPGMIAMMKKYKSFTMPVYPSHRTFANPQKVYDGNKELATKVEIVDGKITNYKQPGIPFAIPENGEQAMNNHLLRYYGGYERCGDWLPVQPDGSYYRVGFCDTFVQAENMDKVKYDNDLAYAFANYDAPATLVGTIYLLLDNIDGERRAWIYNAGQRRVRRAPDLAYDNIDDGSEGMTITDSWMGFFGALDRYDWEIVGKKEMYIPYNAYKLGDTSLKYDEMVDKGHLKSDLMRYELHRVVEIKATVKEGMSHVYAERTFYLDEDSWMVVLHDAYDSRGNLWRVYSNPLFQAYDAKVMWHRAYITHDLVSGAFITRMLDNERKQPALTFGIEGRYSEFQTSAIRRKGTR